MPATSSIASAGSRNLGTIMKRFMGSSWGLGTVTSEGHARGRSPVLAAARTPSLFRRRQGATQAFLAHDHAPPGTDEAEVRAHERSTVRAAGGSTHPELPGLSRHRVMKPTESIDYEMDIQARKQNRWRSRHALAIRSHARTIVRPTSNSEQ